MHICYTKIGYVSKGILRFIYMFISAPIRSIHEYKGMKYQSTIKTTVWTIKYTFADATICTSLIGSLCFAIIDGKVHVLGILANICVLFHQL